MVLLATDQTSELNSWRGKLYMAILIQVFEAS